MNKERNKNFWKVSVVLAIAFILSFGLTMAKQTKQEIAVNSMTVAEAHDGCPCNEIFQQLIEQIRTGTLDLDIGSIPEFDESQFCEWFDEGSQIARDNELLTDGCGLSFSYSFDSESSPQSQEPQESQQSQDTPGIYDGSSESGETDSRGDSGGYDPFLPGGTDSGLMEGLAQVEEYDAPGITLSYYTYTMTEDEVIERDEAIRNWCQDGEDPSGSFDDDGPGDWPLGRAMAFCGGAVGATLQIPAYLVSTIVWAFGMMFCLDAMIYAWLAQQLDQFDIRISEIFWMCVNLLTGGSHGGI